MKIIKFSVNNFRGISGGLDSNAVNFENSNTIFIFGQNNTGKSSFLKAYSNFYYDTTPCVEDFHMQDPKNEIIYELEVELDDHDKQRMEPVSKKTGFLFNNYVYENKLKLQKIWKIQSGGKAKKPTIESTNKTFDPKKKVWDEKNYGGIGLHEVFRECLPQPILIQAMPTEVEVETTVATILEIKAKESLDAKESDVFKQAVSAIENLREKMYDQTFINTYQTKVNEQFQKLFSDLAISLEPQAGKNNLTLTALAKKFQVNFDHLNDDGSINKNIPTSYSNVGHGAIRAALFVLFLMKDIADGFERKEGKKNYLVLFEEPELFLHPKLLRTLRKLIYQISESHTPYQVLCASHSPQMIDITKPKSSLVRMVKKEGVTQLHQIDEAFLMDDKNKVKKELYEVLRFNPHICESFYADEVILVEGDSEAIVLRAFLQVQDIEKDLFIVNCASVNNIPFFQEVFSKFSIKYHVICDSDGNGGGKYDEHDLPIFDRSIQKSIYNLIRVDHERDEYDAGLLCIHETNFEDAHRNVAVAKLKYPFDEAEIKKHGKPFCANEYWNKVLALHIGGQDILQVPIIKNLKEIIQD